MKPELQPVPELPPYAPPACKTCGTPFTDTGKSHSWLQACNCEDSGATSHIIHYKDGVTTRQGSEYLDPALIGQPRYHYCLFCRENLMPGTEAMYGNMGQYGYYGYAHPACYEADLAKEREAEGLRVAAAAGAKVAIWYSLDDDTVPAPRTGHREDMGMRALPANLPALPDGSVVYQEYKRPFAMCRIDIPDTRAAETWWTTATAVPAARYELHWYENPKEKATRSWTGAEFGAVESRARYAEAQAAHNPYA